METFGARLARALRQRGPLCVGIDPHTALLHQWGLTDTVDGLARFCEIATSALAGVVPVIKPQSAFFERFGSAGIAVLESTIRQCHAGGAMVLLDVKRGDIGSTAAAYAEAYLHPGSSLAVDAITVSPYLGFGALAPFLDLAAATGRGVFVLALTSNPEGAQVQHARGADGRTVAQALLDQVALRNLDATPMGSVGVVIGATTGSTGHDLSRLNGPVLAPGLGAQGATAADLAEVFGQLRGMVLPSSSREILAAGPDPERLRTAAERSFTECRKVLNYPDS
ncbi:MAG TPA: orotidine-5'-phosphate decarboxylase [Micromonosporaceae bacterium]